MKTLIPFIIFLVVVIGLIAFSARARRRQAASQSEQAERIAVGSEVMTTSGLYGTVVARNDDDDTVQMSIAPGVEVKWAIAALRDIAALPAQYRRSFDGPLDDAGDPDEVRRLERGVDLDKPRMTDTGGAEATS